MELVRRDVRGSTPGWASSRGRFFGPCFTSRPPSRDVVQPEVYSKKHKPPTQIQARYDIYEFARTRKTRFYSLVASPPPGLTFFVQRIVQRPSTICRAQFIGQRFSSDGTVSFSRVQPIRLNVLSIDLPPRLLSLDDGSRRHIVGIVIIVYKFVNKNRFIYSFHFNCCYQVRIQDDW